MKAKLKTGMWDSIMTTGSHAWDFLNRTDHPRCRIATKLPGRTNKDCRKRWHNSVAGGLKKGQWSKGEDAQLSRGVERFGQR
jgi:hypothetical protein